MTSTKGGEGQGEYRPEKIERYESHVDEENLKPDFRVVDESGAHTKTDPAEIALVRRMDMFILVSSHKPPSRFLQCQQAAADVATATSLDHVLLQLPRPKCHRQQSTERYGCRSRAQEQ